MTARRITRAQLEDDVRRLSGEKEQLQTEIRRLGDELAKVRATVEQGASLATRSLYMRNALVQILDTGNRMLDVARAALDQTR